MEYLFRKVEKVIDKEGNKLYHVEKYTFGNFTA